MPYHIHFGWNSLTFPCHNLLTVYAATFPNDRATVMIAIDGIHSYHISIGLVFFFVKQKCWTEFHKSFVYEKPDRKLFTKRQIDSSYDCCDGSTFVFFSQHGQVKNKPFIRWNLTEFSTRESATIFIDFFLKFSFNFISIRKFPF